MATCSVSPIWRLLWEEGQASALGRPPGSPLQPQPLGTAGAPGWRPSGQCQPAAAWGLVWPEQVSSLH